MKPSLSTSEFNQIDPIKFTAILNVLYTLSFFCFYWAHVSTWTENQAPKPFTSPFFSVYLSFSVFFIILSGASLRLNINNILQDHQSRLSNYKIGPALPLVLLACSFKSMLLFGTCQFFRWEAPYAIAVSLILLIAITRIHIYLCYLVFLMFIAFRFILFDFLNPILTKLLPVTYMISPFADTLIIKTVIIFLILITLIKFKKKLHVKSNFKYFLYFFFILISALWLKSDSFYASTEVSIFKSLPFGIMIGNSKQSQHAFGLIFWLPIVMAGFILTDLILKLKNNLIFLLVVFSASVATLCYLFYEFIQLQRDTIYYSIADMGNQFIVDPVSSNTLLFSSLFIVSIYILNLFFSNIKNIKFFKVISQSIFYQYLFITLFGSQICIILTLLVPKYNFIASLVVLLFMGLVLAYILDYLTSFRLEFTLKRSSKLNSENAYEK